MINNYLLAIFEIVVYFSIFFIIAQWMNNNSIVDIGWGLGFVSGVPLLMSIVWFPLIMGGGALMIALYCFIAMLTSEGNMKKVLLGKRY